MEIALEKKLSAAGYIMFGESTRIEQLINDILKTDNMRYLKAIPYLIYKYDINISSMLDKSSNRELFLTILDITALIFNRLHIQKKIIPRSKRGDATLEGRYAQRFAAHQEEFKEEFETQLRNENKQQFLIDTQKSDEERNLQFGLSQLFTPKEKYIIKRLQEEKPVSKTDYEYYSRKTKKKIRSIIILNDFAQGIYPKTPHFDDELFELKKALEDWLADQYKLQGILDKFMLSQSNLILELRDALGETSITTISLKKIKDEKILSTFKKYKTHDFR